MERGVLKSTPPWSRNPHETLESGRQSCTDRVSAGWYSKLDILAFVCLWASGDWVSLSLYRGHLVLFNWCMVHFLHTFLLLLFTPDVMLWEPVVGGSYIPMCLTIIQENTHTSFKERWCVGRGLVSECWILICSNVTYHIGRSLHINRLPPQKCCLRETRYTLNWTTK